MYIETQPRWNLECIKEFNDGFKTFVEGQTYGVKDKFVGDDGTVETGYWEVRNNGWLSSISLEDRNEHFKVI